MYEHAATLWAKSTTSEGDWQPLWAHLIDVGVVARVLLEHWLTAPARRALARGLGMGEDDALVWAAGLAALHDLGKATPHFQVLSARDAERVVGIGHPVEPRRRHDLLTAVLLPDALANSAVQPAVAGRLGRLLGGHHGRFTDPALDTTALAQRIVGNDRWQEVRSLLVRSTLEVLEVPLEVPPVRVEDHAAARLLGLTVLADWLASAPTLCSYAAREGRPAPVIDVGARAAVGASELPAKLSDLGFRRPPLVARPRSFAKLFPNFPSPRSGQRLVEELAADLEEPGLILVEDATGTGKTEAAFLVVEHALSSLGARGAFVALPTRATSDQAFRRLLGFLRSGYADPTELHLVHSSAAMSVDYEALRAGSSLTVTGVHDEDGESPGGVRASAWFAQRRRGLLSQFAVGTIDQALFAALPVKHHALRLAALADRVVVLDEIHAYDAYMSTLIERLLEWLGALRATVVLLSATLPRSRRDALLAAYGRGIGFASTPAPEVAYPRVVRLGRDGAVARSISTEAPTACVVELVPAGDAKRPLGAFASQVIEEAVEQGGCVAVIMNTVARAQATYGELSHYIEEGRRRLLHARFRFLERDELERAVAAEFGPPNCARRPSGSVVVATQVLEQSLDVDFDLLVTDLAPIDLLLQRGGRLHRHERERPEGVNRPRMLVLAAESDGILRIDEGSARVYEPHILLRTWIALRGHGSTLTVPYDVEHLIEAVYGPADPPHEAGLAATWHATRAKLERALAEDEQRARAVRVPAPGADEPFDARPLSDADDDEASRDLRATTRLGHSVSAVVLRADEANLVGKGLDHDNVRRLLERSVSFGNPRLLRAVVADQPPAAWRENPFLYDHRLLLLDDADRWEAAPGTRPLAIRLDPELGIVIES